MPFRPAKFLEGPVTAVGLPNLTDGGMPAQELPVARSHDCVIIGHEYPKVTVESALPIN